MSTGIVVVGAQWGDEGKGKVVDHLATDAAVVVRYQGGANAGHTLVVGGQKTVLHLVPSGILHPGKCCAIGAGCVVDPHELATELASLRAAGVAVEPDRMWISLRAQLVLPPHQRLDKAREAAAGAKRLGTTGRGIGPAYEDAVGRRGVRMVDLLDPDRLRSRVEGVLRERNLVLEGLGAEPFTTDEVLAPLLEIAEELGPFITDVGHRLDAHLRAGDIVLFEGAQGSLLDVSHGTYPFVTSSATVAGSASVGAGVGPGAVGRVVGITKAYATRVGAGPFPTELNDETGERLRRVGAEFGATTGRPRRCGWFDAVALRYAARINGLTEIALTKLDVLSGLETLQIAVGYKADGVDLESFPAVDLEQVEPVFETVEGWSEPIEGARVRDALPEAARAYVRRLEELVGVPVSMVSVGPGREAIIPWSSETYQSRHKSYSSK